MIGTGILSPTTATLEGGEVVTTANMDSSIPNHTNIITYFLHPTDLAQTQIVCDFIVQYQRHHRNPVNSSGIKSSTPMKQLTTSMVHHRIVYIPQIPAMVHKLLSNAGLIGSNSSSKIGRAHV